MGEDKALLQLGGRSLVEIAVEKLRRLCAEVSIAGNRSDLAAFAPVVMEARVDVGPGAGIEAGLRAAAGEEWCLFVPVDVPLLPVELLRAWAGEVIGADGVRGSFLVSNGQRQPSICMLHRACGKVIADVLDSGERKLAALFEAVGAEFGPGAVLVRDASAFAPGATAAELERWFLNVNTPGELAEAARGLKESRAQSE
jgi:molybdopterin-guanine dinucleotide biosynthesis protein A